MVYQVKSYQLKVRLVPELLISLMAQKRVSFLVKFTRIID
ncbi:hypothetical protein O53_3576 [Microcystis aeruginosa TAIHU98]|uniref:Uncharacterized protein n=2 Tax=Microcystis aeruginosa TaxID=1126 RepID=L7E7B0_MICAE|nr:hypothetical protein BH695_3509 [Microcystis aeruginosa PCC 7806SL]ELP54751.1 hypothetical protein O53_3576 [Microcystis aeruginosa TAIHU98]ELS48364.1 hypothetical protein C789_1834 [Microcystis aeruginosa FACHB-905 = DIANCHI905]ODV39013.1 hypothetical protein BFG60_1480 [Microcystis aeruginosa NIES-98]